MLANEETGVFPDGNENPGDENMEVTPEKRTTRKKLDVKDRPQFKRKKAQAYSLLDFLI